MSSSSSATIEDTDSPRVRTHQSSYLAAPEEWLGSEFFIEAKALERSNEKAYRHEYLGEAVGAGGEVFENLSLEKISDESIERFDNIRMGLDWGFSSDPLAWMKGHFDKRRRVLFLFDEMVASDLSDGEAARLLKARGVNGRDRIICDSADPKTISNYRNLGFNASGCRKYNGSVEHGVKWLQDLEMIVIDPVRCPVAAKEFSSYSYKLDTDGSTLPVLMQKNDHTIDAVRYAMDLEINQVRPASSTFASTL
ncbi:hypothetical protein C4J81_13785 [Deltaproteobacteria bacterium Smac51]|nr:hypothetical protein C4J81_13785 [Deltaproteobacteria bacterium Smac51]